MEEKEFLNFAFDSIQQMITEKKDSFLISNYDAFKFLINLLSSSTEFLVINNCLERLKNLLLSNWKNTIISCRLNLIDHLVLLLKKLFLVEEEIEEGSNF